MKYLWIMAACLSLGALSKGQRVYVVPEVKGGVSKVLNGKPSSGLFLKDPTLSTLGERPKVVPMEAPKRKVKKAPPMAFKEVKIFGDLVRPRVRFDEKPLVERRFEALENPEFLDKIESPLSDPSF